MLGNVTMFMVVNLNTEHRQVETRENVRNKTLFLTHQGLFSLKSTTLDWKRPRHASTNIGCLTYESEVAVRLCLCWKLCIICGTPDNILAMFHKFWCSYMIWAWPRTLINSRGPLPALIISAMSLSLGALRGRQVLLKPYAPFTTPDSDRTVVVFELLQLSLPLSGASRPSGHFCVLAPSFIILYSISPMWQPKWTRKTS